MACFDCISTYFISDYSTHLCSLCSVGVTNCLTCNEKLTATNFINCIHCDYPYYADASGQTCNACTNLDAQCSNCTEVTSNGNVTGGICIECTSPFWAATDGTCLTCSNSTYNCAGCSQYGTGNFSCTSCSSGYYLNSATPVRCEACPSLCATCSALTVCTSCVNDTYFVNTNNTCQ
jgi:hypothetical protein